MTYVSETSVLGVSVFFVILGTLAVAARVFVQLKNSRLRADDWLSVASWSLVMGECGIMIAGSITHTVGAHSATDQSFDVLDYDGWDQILLERFEYPFDVMQICALATLKLSVLLFYRRIFVTKTFRVYNTILIGVVIIWTITFFVCLLAQCGSNIGTNFGTLGDLKAKCTDTFAILIGLAASDVAVDLAILSIPIPLVISLHLPLKKRLAIIAVLMIGMLATACGIVRMSLFIEILGPALFSKPTVGGVSSHDDIGIISILMFWGMLEMGIAVVATCLPVLYSLRHYWPPRSLMAHLRLLGRSQVDKSSIQKGMHVSEAKLAPWSGTQTRKHIFKTNNNAESQIPHLSEMNIWEQTEITQTTEMV